MGSCIDFLYGCVVRYIWEAFCLYGKVVACFAYSIIYQHIMQQNNK